MKSVKVSRLRLFYIMLRDPVKTGLNCFIVTLLFLTSSSLALQVPRFYGQEVVVTATRRLQLKSESPAKVVVLTAKDIAATGANNLYQALRYTEGLDLKISGGLGAQSTLRLRGSNAEQVLLLVNGNRISSPLLGLSDLTDILVDNVEQIEVVYGPASSLYGSAASGGVVNVITKQPELLTKRQVGFGYDSYGGSRADFSLVNNDYLFSIASKISKGFQTNSDYIGTNYQGEVRFALSQKAKVCLGLNGYLADRGVPGSSVYPTPNTRQSDWNNYLNGGLDLDLSPKYKINLKGRYASIQQRYNANPTLYANEKYDAESLGIGLKSDLQINSAHQLAVGVDFDLDGSDSDMAGRHKISNQAFYFQSEHRANQQLLLNLGLRVDRHSVAGESLSPRIGLVYQASQDLVLRSSFGTAFRAPTLNELYWYYNDPVWGLITRGNQNLRPEKSQTWDVGLTKRFDDSTQATLTGYISKYSDMIKWVDISGVWATWEAQNLSAADSIGADLSLKRKFTEACHGFVNYSYQNSIDLSTGNKLVYSPVHKANAGLVYEPEDRLSGSFYVRYVGERFDNAANTGIAPAYTVADLKVWQTIADVKVSVGVE
ncbi:hypothetical protein A2548_01425, partial [candidate division WOR-1 bacterium RIFOXYD2_FULL_41_8]